MDKDYALKMASDIGIDVQQVLREEVELVFLKGLLESTFSDRLIFKGGTALRLVYGSFRFSEDLDFSPTDKIDFKEFRQLIEDIIRTDERFSIKDLAEKHYTHLAQIRIKESWQDMAFSMKIELSKRVLNDVDANYENLLAKSPVTNISVMVKVFTLARMLEDKLRTIKERKMPRDVFDIWFIYQKENKLFDLNNFGYSKGKIKQELRKFLPKRFYPVIDDLERLNAKCL